MVAESWFRNLWKQSHKHEGHHEKTRIGVLAFEVASLMSKLVHLWQSLSDKQVNKLREDVSNSVGIKKLISEDEDYIVRLICTEMIDNLGKVAKAVARLGKKCDDPGLTNLEYLFDDLIKLGFDSYGLECTSKKMEKKVKKMEKLISRSASLYQEMEMLSELEQTLRRMTSYTDLDGKNLFEYQKKVVWKRQEVRTLQEASLWNKTYDYTVRLMTQSIFTIFSRIKQVFGIFQNENIIETQDSEILNSDHILRSQSVAVLMQSSVQLSDNGISGFSSGPLGKLPARSGPHSEANMKYKFLSGPLGKPSSRSGPIHPANTALNFHSGPLGKPSTKTGPISKKNIFGLKLWYPHKKSSEWKSNLLTPTRPLKSCVAPGESSVVNDCLIPNVVNSSSHELQSNILNFSSKSKLLTAPPETLGAAALELHYANVIIVIEKFVASPHLIGQDARDDLYNMLPSSIRVSLRSKLKPFSKALASSVFDTVLAGEWSGAMTRILEWLAPLAHSTIRWQSERSYEQQNLCARSNVLLAQTLYFANQEKTEAVITELLVGLNYIWRYGREVNAKAFLECSSTTKFRDYLDEEA